MSKIGSDAVRGKPSSNRLPDGVAAFNSLYMSYKRNAVKIREISFKLSKDQFAEITKSNCVYCGSKPYTVRNGEALRSKGKSSGEYIYNGIDRVDSSKGYEIDNVVPCCSRCNYMKGTLTVDEFYSHIEKIFNLRAPASGKRVYYP